jgi:hypothetical protein
MSVYHQMGHHSDNLIDLPELSQYAGAIFSPINCTQAAASAQIREVRDTRGTKDKFEVLFDPQLYVPSTRRGNLRKWSYFPKDFDTADLGSRHWWAGINEKLAKVSREMRVDAVCSPTVIPKGFTDKYYIDAVSVCNELIGMSRGTGSLVVQTILVSLGDLAASGSALRIASLVSRTEADRVYLVLVGSVAPRRELTDVDEIVSSMQLIAALERSELPVIVGFCSSDLILWKAAGASSCASGKFFNLRRFTRQRFEEPLEGGGQLPYWFEEGLLAFLRQGDIVRARRQDLISKASLSNPFSMQILERMDEAERSRAKVRPWQAISWRQFLYWFADVEARLSKSRMTTEDLLTEADANWTKLDKAKVLMEERGNDGTWIRNWLNAFHEFRGNHQ